ncbi:MAG: RluA family pseudouridine synthase [Spirochaetota bacterium]
MSSNYFKSFYPGIDDEGKRIDKIIRVLLPKIALSTVYSNLRKGRIKVNGTKVDPSYRVKTGDVINIHEGLTGFLREYPASSFSGKTHVLEMGAMILFENDNIIAINKKPGVVVHGENSLKDQIDTYLKPVLQPSLSFNPGPLHRLDRNTSGIILFGKTLLGAQRFSSILKSRNCSKWYVGLIEGRMTLRQLWRDRIVRNRETKVSKAGADGKGKTAITAVTPLILKNDFSFVLFRLITGITHQIRIQSSLHGFPLAGDTKYHGKRKLQVYILHAISIQLPEYDDILGFQRLYAPLPEESHTQLVHIFGSAAMAACLNTLEGQFFPVFR